MLKTNTIAGIALAVILTSAVLILRSGKLETGDDSTDVPTFTVAQGPLVINVVESGTIQAKEQIILKSQVEGKTSIIYLIPEGTHVKEGDLLVQLDASSLMDSRIDQDIKVQNAEAGFINSKENLAVVENQARSDIELAELTLDFARQDREKYIEGEYPNELRQTEAKITLAEEELTRARDTLKWSRTLNQEKYLSQTELMADQLSEKKKALDLEMAKNQLDLLTNYTYKRTLAKHNSDVSQAEMALDRTRRKAKASIIQAQAELKAKEAEYQRQKDKLAKLNSQIEKTKIHAPAEGLVIYATSAKRGGYRHSVEPLEEGQEVRERQELIYLPIARSMKAEIDVHESNLKKIHLGMPVMITVDALPGQTFTGNVATIAPLPDAQSIWMNPDLKVYATEIYLDANESDIRTGMSCQAEIIIENHRQALFVPVQAVLQVAGKPTVWVKSAAGFTPRAVETGLDNNRMVHVTGGLDEGDVVLLTPPLKAAGADLEKRRGPAPAKDKMREKSSDRPGKPAGARG